MPLEGVSAAEGGSDGADRLQSAKPHYLTQVIETHWFIVVGRSSTTSDVSIQPGYQISYRSAGPDV